MSKMINNWEPAISNLIPYLQWSELSNGPIDYWGTGRHNHAAYELHIIVSGSSKLSVNNTELSLKAGQGILIAPEVYHAPESILQPFGRISATFFPEQILLQQLCLKSIGEYWLFDVDNVISSLCESICEEAKQLDSLFHTELMANRFAELILRVFRIIKETSDSSHAASSRLNPPEDMMVIDRFFVATPPNLRTRENLSKLLHCSQRQVLRKIQTLYGMSFQKKLMLSKIDTAQHLLSTTGKTIEEICSLVGYADKAAFYKAFSQYSKTTPVRYRKNFK